MRIPYVVAISLIVLVLLTAVAAQSPNTASMIVVVADQNGAVVKDARVSVVNTATGELPGASLAQR